jgi:hypothetical protein
MGRVYQNRGRVWSFCRRFGISRLLFAGHGVVLCPDLQAIEANHALSNYQCHFLHVDFGRGPSRSLRKLHDCGSPNLVRPKLDDVDDYSNTATNQAAIYVSAGCTKEQTRLDTGAVCMICASLLHLVGFFVTNGYLAFVKEEKKALLLLARATQKEKLALTTGQAVGEEHPLTSGANEIVVMASGECDA